MGKRWLAGLVVVVAIAAVGGIGFAAFTTSAFIKGNASAGTLGPLYWSDVSGCSASTSTTNNGSDTLVITALNMAPGDSCTVTGTLNNGGSLPANVYSEVTCVNPAEDCLVFTYWDSFSPYPNGYDVSGGPFGPLAVPAEGSIPYTGTLGLPSGLGNEYQGITCQFEITLTASAGT